VLRQPTTAGTDNSIYHHHHLINVADIIIIIINNAPLNKAHWHCTMVLLLQLCSYRLTYQVRQKKSNPLKLFTVFSATAWNLSAKFYKFM